MLKSIITAVALTAGLSLATVHAAEQAEQPAQQAPESVNPFDPNSWISGFAPQGQGGTFNWFDPSSWARRGAPAMASGPMQFNAAHPAAWAKWFDPATHNTMHRAFSNPATYAQFMTPQFYMQFMNPNNWMAWMNPGNYGVFFNPANYTYWMNPAAYMHVMDLSNYMQTMNPANYMVFMNPMTYMQWMNPAAYTLPGADLAAGGMFNWFDPSTWAGMMQPQTPEQAPKQ